MRMRNAMTPQEEPHFLAGVTPAHSGDARPMMARVLVLPSATCDLLASTTANINIAHPTTR